jgi:GntR family transcriptional regulator
LKPSAKGNLAVRLHVSPSSGVPIYLQIINQIKYLVASGQFESGDALPPIRTLAEQLLINPNTVARAYRELEAAGIVASRVGSGTVVTSSGSPLARRERLRLLTEDVDALLAQANQLDFEIDEVIDLVRRRHREIKASSE